jgi:CRP/FNR family transcriptional regulator
MTTFLKKGECLTHEFNDENCKLYKIVVGLCKLNFYNSDAKKLTYTLNTGDFYLYPSCYDTEIQYVEVEALEPSVLVVEECVEPIYQQQEILSYLFENISDKKILGFLKYIGNKIGIKTKENGVSGIKIDVKISHHEMASFCGLTRVTVTKTLKKLKEEGKIVATIDRKIFIPD